MCAPLMLTDYVCWRKKTLKNDFENFPPLNVTASFCAGLEMSFDNDNEKKQILYKLSLFPDCYLAYFSLTQGNTGKKHLEIWHKMDSKSCICTSCVS